MPTLPGLRHAPRSCPLLRSQWRFVELISAGSPVRHAQIHEFNKVLVVRALNQVGELVNHDVFEATRVLLGQLRVEPNGP